MINSFVTQKIFLQQVKWHYNCIFIADLIFEIETIMQLIMSCNYIFNVAHIFKYHPYISCNFINYYLNIFNNEVSKYYMRMFFYSLGTWRGP